MRHCAPWAMSLALLAGVGVVAAAQEAAPPTPDKQATGNWFTNLWPFGQQPQKKAAPPSAAKSPLVDNPRTLLERERAVLNRREEVCYKLLVIANGTHDDELKRRAEQLQEQAWNLYLQRTGRVPAENGFQSDEETLANNLSPAPNGGSLAARPTGPGVSQAAAKEERR